MADSARRLPWLYPEDRVALILTFAVLMALLAVHYVLRSGLGADPVALERSATLEAHRVDINCAEIWELQALRGIGEKTAQAIVEHRSAHGPFGRVEALAAVSGIGAVTLERLRPFLTTSGRKEAK